MLSKMNKTKTKGFTLVELLAVIVILAIILVIAVPKVMSVIEDSKKATLESTAKMIASGAEKQKVQNTVLGNNEEITCDSVAKINNLDYASCSIKFENNTAKVTIEGKGKFENLWVCDGTKINAVASDEECKLTLTSSNFESILCKDVETCTLNNLLKDEAGNIRYYGSNPNNYIEFNDEIWRIIGVFDIKTNASDTNEQKELRIKIVRNDMLSYFRQYDSAPSNIWQNSDLKEYLNGDYYNSLQSKLFISKAVWNTGMLTYDSNGTSPENVYNQEKTVQTIEGIMGLVSISDYAYARGTDCVGVELESCKTNNWLILSSGPYYAITPASNSDYNVWGIYRGGVDWDFHAGSTYGVRPVTYLNSNIKLTGTGENTEEGIYKIS